ncbi:MAG: transcription antitermination factor NusB [Planctomycetes bacterium]|nr:transcription antitermination factor NusB [Planctomycetota bacterium]
MRKRTRARELALQALYQLDLRGEEVREQVDAQLQRASQDPEVLEFARTLVHGAWSRRADIDRKIEDVARNWELRRMAAIDRNILRLATYELLYLEEIPPLVTINEAIDMAKKYSTKKSGNFVNGILDHIRVAFTGDAERRSDPSTSLGAGEPPPATPPDKPTEGSDAWDS